MNTIDFIRSIHKRPDEKTHAAILMNWIKFDEEGNEVINEDTFFDQSFTIDKFEDRCKALADEEFEDVYFSINSYRKTHRTEENTWRLNAFVLDYDYYRYSKYKDLDAEDMYNNHIKETLPLEPNFIIDSGRGLYVIYTFDPVPKQMLGFYKRIYRELVFEQKKFNTGIDVKASLATQVIRLPGTYNSKTNSEVTIIDSNQIDYSITSFEHLLPHSREEIIQLMEDAKPIDEDEVVKETIEEKQINLSSRQNNNLYHFKRIYRDFKRLVKLRNYNDIHSGYREYMLYATRYLAECSDLERKIGINYAKKLNKLFKEPMRERDVEVQCKPSKVSEYRISIEKLISNLEISADEMINLTSLTTSDLKYKKSLKKKSTQRRNFKGYTKAEEEIAIRRIKIVKLLREGKKQADIVRVFAEEGNVISKSTVSRDIQFYKDNPYLFVRELKEVLLSKYGQYNDLNESSELDIEMKLWLLEWLKNERDFP